jgi:hypothetical protein
MRTEKKTCGKHRQPVAGADIRDCREIGLSGKRTVLIANCGTSPAQFSADRHFGHILFLFDT